MNRLYLCWTWGHELVGDHDLTHTRNIFTRWDRGNVNGSGAQNGPNMDPKGTLEPPWVWLVLMGNLLFSRGNSGSRCSGHDGWVPCFFSSQQGSALRPFGPWAGSLGWQTISVGPSDRGVYKTRTKVFPLDYSNPLPVDSWRAHEWHGGSRSAGLQDPRRSIMLSIRHQRRRNFPPPDVYLLEILC